MLYYFSEHNYRGNHAGTKARNDVEEILRSEKAIPINSKPFVLQSRNNDQEIYSNVNNRIDVAHLFWDIKKIKHQMVLIQYPMLAFDFQRKYLMEIAKRNRLILLVHDIHSLRMPDKINLQQEIELLNMAEGIIVHNRFMEQKLKELGVNVNHYYSLNVFDYLYGNKDDSCLNEYDINSPRVAFAGNLAKSKFLLKLIDSNKDVKLKLYGPIEENNVYDKNVEYVGNFSPDEIPGKMKADYGLVWDGDRIEGCEGSLGEYTKINNPHKLSLYLAAGIPIIVWEKAAVAEFTRVNNVGLTVDRIDNLKDVLSKITPQEYDDMKKAVQVIREGVIHGNNLKKVLRQIQE